MLHILSSLFRQFRQWERPSQAGFVLAILLMVPTLVATREGSDNLRLLATIAFMGLIITAQIIFMWANRGMVTPFSRAQRFYMREDFPAAIDILEELRDQGNADFRALTLLGNAYRQVGQLAESESVLFEAINNYPDHYFPHYGFGRTLLTQGRYMEAVTRFETALRHGAPSGVRFDLGEALYRAGDASALDHLREVRSHSGLEVYRELMTAYMLYELDAGPPPELELFRNGVAFWENVARIHADTIYGSAVARDIESMKVLSRGG